MLETANDQLFSDEPPTTIERGTAIPDHRKGEPPERHFRSDRVVMARGRWYVVTRERIDVGPYATKEAAEAASEQLGQALDGIDDPAIALALISEFVRRRNAGLD